MYVVTGGAGFIGSHIAATLLDRGQAVRVFDNRSTGNLAYLESIGVGVEFIEGDVRDAEAVRRAIAGAEVVFHQGAEASVPRSIDDPVSTYEVNVTGTLNVLLAARDAGCRRVVFASSSAVYGDNPDMPKHERMLPSPISPYASSKLAGEELCAVFARAYGLETVALRYFNVFGPRQDPSSAYAAVIPRFVEALTRGERPVIFGDGEQSRDFIYVGDVVSANMLASSTPGVAGKVFNIASGHAITLNALARELSSILGVESDPIYRPVRAGDVRHSLADISSARSQLGFTPATSFVDGLRSTIDASVVVAA